eukprot:m.323413 g.323413  ORF g.323413 m.323413 type:complete len:118 (+) comp55525_c0_seq1:919-1272(+)
MVPTMNAQPETSESERFMRPLVSPSVHVSSWFVLIYAPQHPATLAQCLKGLMLLPCPFEWIAVVCQAAAGVFQGCRVVAVAAKTKREKRRRRTTQKRTGRLRPKEKRHTTSTHAHRD